MYRSAVLAPSVKEAQENFQKQQYGAAVAKYTHLIKNHPDSEKRQYFMVEKGRALYLLRSFHDAEKTFRQYMRLYPDGLYRAEAEAYLTKIQVLRSQKEQSDQLVRETIKDDIKVLKEMLKRDPYNAHLHYNLANKLWNLEKYEEAASYYLKAAEIDAALQESELINNRLMIDENGEVVPITPDIQQEIEKEKNPLVIFDTHQYQQRNRPDTLGVSKSFQTITGKVRNQSQNVLRNVSVYVEFYNMHHEILDTQSYYVGTMAPREVRAFLVKGRNFDTIDNIDHIEYSASYH